jgi:flagellar basal body P-ring formation protein FlgA
MSERIIKILPNMAKILLVLLIMVMSMAAFIASIHQAAAATPIQNVTITGDNITLGDVFSGIEGKDASFVLAPAPMPGTTLTWNANTLNRIANAFNLSWRAASSDTIQIRRLASIVTEDMIKNAIVESLTEQGMSKDQDLEFVGVSPQIILPHEIEPSVTVVSSSYNPDRQSFSATLRAADNSVTYFSGVAHSVATIPVLKTPLRRGDVITRNMITMIDIRENNVTDDMVIRADELIGMTPRKILRANAPVALSELDKPTMVQRGDLVTMQLKNGPIAITAIAKAMESGTKGDIIRLMNVGSKRVLEAQVTGLREASVLN